jgi:hypothetical protein
MLKRVWSILFVLMALSLVACHDDDDHDHNHNHNHSINLMLNNQSEQSNNVQNINYFSEELLKDLYVI